MKYVKEIFDVLNKNWASRIFTLILIAALTYSAINIFAAKGKSLCEDCTFYKTQNKELLGALIDIKKDLQSTMTTSFTGTDNGLMFAAYDSLPKRRMNNQQQQVQRTINKIDSLIKIYSVQQKQKI